MTKIYFTQEQIQQIIDLYKQGVGIANIGKYLIIIMMNYMNNFCYMKF